MTEGKWIRFVLSGDTGKTLVYDVQNKESFSIIGQVKWYGSFRQYSFFPKPETVYERQCLLDITKFLHYLMLQRKLKRELIK